MPGPKGELIYLESVLRQQVEVTGVESASAEALMPIYQVLACQLKPEHLHKDDPPLSNASRPSAVKKNSLYMWMKNTLVRREWGLSKEVEPSAQNSENLLEITEDRVFAFLHQDIAALHRFVVKMNPSKVYHLRQLCDQILLQEREKARTEFICAECSDHFGTEDALNRHNKKAHN